MERTSLIREIAKIVEDNWKTTKSPLLLSKLGNEASGEIARNARSYAGSLANFIEKEVADVRIVNHSKIASLTGAVPERITDNPDDLLAQVQRSRAGKITGGQQDVGRKDLLRFLLESLSESDAKRMDIPLDIAQKLSQVRM